MFELQIKIGINNEVNYSTNICQGYKYFSKLFYESYFQRFHCQNISIFLFFSKDLFIYLINLFILKLFLLFLVLCFSHFSQIICQNK